MRSNGSPCFSRRGISTRSTSTSGVCGLRSGTVQTSTPCAASRADASFARPAVSFPSESNTTRRAWSAGKSALAKSSAAPMSVAFRVSSAGHSASGALSLGGCQSCVVSAKPTIPAVSLLRFPANDLATNSRAAFAASGEMEAEASTTKSTEVSEEGRSIRSPARAIAIAASSAIRIAVQTPRCVGVHPAIEPRIPSHSSGSASNRANIQGRATSIMGGSFRRLSREKPLGERNAPRSAVTCHSRPLRDLSRKSRGPRHGSPRALRDKSLE